MKKVSSYYSGRKVGEKVFFDTIKKFGSDAVYILEKTKATCAEYCSNMRLKKTKKGIELSKDKREFYQGMYEFLAHPQYEGCND